MLRMLLLYEFLMDKVDVPRFPLYGATTEEVSKDKEKKEKRKGLNLNLIEEIVCGVQSRLYLYIMTPETGMIWLITL